MSSRARLVQDEVSPYDWRAGFAALPPAPVTFETVDVYEEPSTTHGATLVDERRLAEIERDAFAKGYQQGERAGAEAAGAQARGLLGRLAGAIDEVSSTRQAMIRRTEQQVVELAMAIAKQMLQRELNVDRGLLLGMARVALDRLGDHEVATVRLHPDDYAIVDRSPDRASAGDQLTVVADSSVERGGCLVQCDAGLMKVGLESQFAELARTLLGGDVADTDRTEARHGTAAAA
ncbi:MAG: FliH/SctL family protein [Acidobacteriota bacterium]